MATALSTERLGHEHEDLVVPWPLVDWTAVAQAADPLREPTRGRLRELRKQGHVSGGITVTRRGERGLQGKASYHSVLSALAERCRRDGEDADAAALAKASTLVEVRFREELQAFLATRTLAELGAASFVEELAIATAEGLSGWRHMDKVLMASAVVTGLDGNTAHLRGVSPEGAPVDVDLPRLLVERQALAVGDRAWVFSQVAGGAALVEVTPALRVSVSKATAKRSQALPGVQCDIVWHAEAAPVGDDGLTDDERTAYARRYAATAGANLDAQQLSDIEQALADGEIPRRRFRPAG